MSLTKKDLPDLIKFRQTLDGFMGQFFDLSAPLGYTRILPELYSLREKVEGTIRALDTFWTYEDDTGIGDFEFTSKEEAIEYAEDFFAEDIVFDCVPRDGQSFTKDIELLRFEYDEKGERVEVERIPYTVTYTHDHGDRAEHFRQSDYI